MAESFNCNERRGCTTKKESLKQEKRNCEDTTYTRDDRQACYRWAEKKSSGDSPDKKGPMQQKPETPFLVDLDILNTYNEKGCEVCNRKFSLGETVVMASGPWSDEKVKLIHEQEAVFDENTRTWYERAYYQNLEKS